MLSRPTGDGGAIAVLTAVFAVVVFGLAALVVDLGDVRQLRVKAQNTVDAATLSGANAAAEGATPAQAAQAVKDSAAENAGTSPAEWSSCGTTVPSGWARRGSGTDCILFRPVSGPPDRIQVLMPVRRTLGAFSRVYGSSGIDYNALARAQIRGTPVPGCGLCLFGVQGTALDTRGTVAVTGGDSLAGRSGRVRGSGSVSVAPPGVITFTNTPNPATGPYSPDPTTGAPTDPFASTPGPPFPLTKAPSDDVTCGPSGVTSLPSAVYEDIDVRGSCTMSGVLAITGELRVRASGRLTGSAATLHFTCGDRDTPSLCTNDDGGELRVDNGGILAITGLSTSVFSVLVDPTNTERRVRIDGSVTLAGALYARAARLDLRSGGSLSVSDVTVADRLTLTNGRTASVDSSGAPLGLGPVDVRLAK